jgi:hypothetical protein
MLQKSSVVNNKPQNRTSFDGFPGKLIQIKVCFETRIFLPLMIRPFFLLSLISALTWAQPSSIDTFPLPEAPSRRFDIEVEQHQSPEEAVWYQQIRFFRSSDGPVRHGVYVERVRTRDREQRMQYFREYRHLYELGERQDAHVISTYESGVLRRRDYVAVPGLVLTVEFNEQGQEINLPGRTARGALRKRERITSYFDTVFEINS